jgi:hypothetical protein
MKIEKEEAYMEIIGNTAFQMAFYKMFLIERNLVGEFSEYTNEKMMDFQSFNPSDTEFNKN